MSECSGENVVIFKSVSESENQEQDVYKKKFLSAGYNVTLVPVLDFEFVNLEQLRSKILRPDDYAGDESVYLMLDI